MLCEMCGKDVEMLTRTRVEGSVLNVCADCSRFGVVLTPPAPATPPGAPARGSAAPGPGRALPRGRSLEERDLYKELPEMELASDWPKRIRTAREKLTWTPEDLGKKLNEKKSVVLKIESGNFHPPDAMVRKIERLLKIRLRAEPESTASS
jgi:putative transcription factor